MNRRDAVFSSPDDLAPVTRTHTLTGGIAPDRHGMRAPAGRLLPVRFHPQVCRNRFASDAYQRRGNVPRRPSTNGRGRSTSRGSTGRATQPTGLQWGLADECRTTARTGSACAEPFGAMSNDGRKGSMSEQRRKLRRRLRRRSKTMRRPERRRTLAHHAEAQVPPPTGVASRVRYRADDSRSDATRKRNDAAGHGPNGSPARGVVSIHWCLTLCSTHDESPLRPLRGRAVRCRRVREPLRLCVAERNAKPACRVRPACKPGSGG